MGRIHQVALVLLLVGVAGFQLAAIPRENVNWDELAMLARTSETIRTGQLQTGGRPGLAALVLIPFVQDCRDSIQAVTAARHLWVGFNLATLVALVLLLRGLRVRSGTLLAVASLALLPVWMRWSLQVRTEQPAAAATLWAGVALLASRRRPAFAVVAGLLAAAGYLCTQKAIYVTALIFTAAAGDLFITRELRVRRELVRLVAFLAGAAATLVAYDRVVALFYRPPRIVSLEYGLGSMAYFRSTFGYWAYHAMLPSLLPHMVLAGLMAFATMDAAVRRTNERRTLIAAWTVAALGLAVGWFHAPAFPYFWITLGLFPAVALALGWPAIVEMMGRHLPSLRALIVGALAALLLWRGGRVVLRTLTDDQQQQQRDAMAFIAARFPPDAHGFQAESALFCRREPDPFPNYFSDRIVKMKDDDIRWLIDEMRRRPVLFIIAHRLLPFPKPVEDFWRTHYVHYHAQVLIPGQRIVGDAGASGTFEVIAAGTYRWWPILDEHDLVVDGTRLTPEQTVTLAVGPHLLSLPERERGGVFALDVGFPPLPSRKPFYDPDVIDEIAPARWRLIWW